MIEPKAKWKQLSEKGVYKLLHAWKISRIRHEDLLYKGIYSCGTDIQCKILGYILFETRFDLEGKCFPWDKQIETLVIEIQGRKHTISQSYFCAMQKNSFRKEMENQDIAE